jgi:hypothetical protein
MISIRLFKFRLLLSFLLGVIAFPLARAVDKNSNGISDIWEAAYPSVLNNLELDHDGDGRTSAQEAIDGTNPLDANDYFHVTDFARSEDGSEVALTFRSLLGRSYEFEETEDFLTWDYSNYSFGTGTISTAYAYPDPAAPRKFFRVRAYPEYDVDDDGDGLLSWEEVLLGTDPDSTDSDNDGMPDGWEFAHHLNPLSAADAAGDPDNDGLSNLWEYRLDLNPRSNDSDGNGILDGLEDRDDDGLGNLHELTVTLTDPSQHDTDLDTLSDGWEIENGFDPLVDNLTDADPDNDPLADPDGDGLVNREEDQNHTSASNTDSDGDGVSDAAEIAQGSNPNDVNDKLPPPAGTVPVDVTFGDHSPSQSEIYRVVFTTLEGDTTPKHDRSNYSYGGLQTNTLRLPKGAKYRVTLKHLSSDPAYQGTPKPDYDYTLRFDATQNCAVLEDPAGMLGLHNEGDAFFAKGKSATLYVPLFEWVTPKGSPVTAPDDAGDGQNEFTYNTASPGVLTVDLDVLVKPTGTAGVTGHDGVKFSDRCVFALPTITGSTFAWDAANTGGKSNTSGEHLLGKATYTTLPANNTDFGAKQAEFACDGHANTLAKADFEVFFNQTETNHPGAGAGTDPNWFFYWRQFVPLGRIQTLNFLAEGFPTTSPITRTTTITQISSEENDETTHRGIHTFYETLAHESHHIVLWEGWWGVGGTRNAAQDTDSDSVPDSFETSPTGLSYGFQVGRNDHYTTGLPTTVTGARWPDRSADYNYEEAECRQVEQNLNEASVDSQDWSHDSTNTNQGKQHK